MLSRPWCVTSQWILTGGYDDRDRGDRGGRGGGGYGGGGGRYGGGGGGRGGGGFGGGRGGGGGRAGGRSFGRDGRAPRMPSGYDNIRGPKEVKYKPQGGTAPPSSKSELV